MQKEAAQESHLSIYPLKSEESTRALSTFLQVLSSCAGPHGRNQIIQNACGGHLTITSTSSRLLNAILVTRPELKLLVNSILGHTRDCCDCGLFMASFSLQLIKSSLKLDVHSSTLRTVFHCFSTMVHDYINSSACKVVVKADFTQLQVLLALTKSILSSKSLLNLKSDDLDSLSYTVLSAFINSVPDHPQTNDSDRIFVCAVEALAVKESYFERGVLLECPELSCFEEVSNLCVKMFKPENGCDVTGNSYIRVAVVSCSLSGDLEEISDALYEVTAGQSDVVENSVLKEMISFCHELQRHDVGILMCQKVIHPKLKVALKSSNILFVERIGSKPLPYLLDVTGCRPISSFLNIGSQIEGHLGKATCVKHRILKNRSYLHVSCDDTNVVTLVLCSEWEERLAELQCCVKACIRSLEFLVSQPKLLMGGGCWQANCSYVLKQKVLEMLPDILEQLSCSKVYLLQALQVFTSSLHYWCQSLIGHEELLAVDTHCFHAWKAPKAKDTGLMNGRQVNCCCGFKSTMAENLQDFEIIPDHCTPSFSHIQSTKTDDCLVIDNSVHGHMILDSFTSASNALYKASLTAGMLLSVGQLIHDKN